MRKLTFVWIFLGIFALLACDDESSDSQPQTCEAATCDADGLLVKCVKEVAQKPISCGTNQVCSNGQCVYQGEDCTDSQCVGDQIRECVNGKLSAATECTGGLVCRKGKCVSNEVVPDCYEDTCVNGQLKECQNGKYLDPQDCPQNQVCEGTACKPLFTGGSCVYDSCTIDAKMRVPCQDGKKQSPVACPEGQHCLFGECSALPQPSDSCDNNSFVLRCADDNHVLRCDGGQVKKENCELKTGFKGSKCQIQGELGAGACWENRVETYERSSCQGSILYEWNEDYHAMIASECTGELDICVETPAGAQCTKSCSGNTPVSCSNNNKPMACVDGGNGSSVMIESSTSTACINNTVYACEANGSGSQIKKVLACDGGKCITSSNPMVLAQAQGRVVCQMPADSCTYGETRCSTGGDVEICTGGAWERIGCREGKKCVMLTNIGAMCADEVGSGTNGIGCETVTHIAEDGTRESVTKFYEFLKDNGKSYEITVGYGNQICYQGGIYECSEGDTASIASNQCEGSKVCNPMSDLTKSINLTRCINKCTTPGTMDCEQSSISRCESIHGKKVSVPTYSADFHAAVSNAICDIDGTRIHTCSNEEVVEIPCENGLSCHQGMRGFKKQPPACAPACQNGESYCDGDQIKVCEDGFWADKELCAGDEACVVFDGQATCAETCDEITHGTKATCFGDEFAQCIEVQGKHVWSHFSGRCNGTALETCVSGQINNSPCNPGEICHKGRCQSPNCDEDSKLCLKDNSYYARCEDGKYFVEACEFVDGKSEAMCDRNPGCYTKCTPSNIDSLGKCKEYRTGYEFCNADGEVETFTCPSGEKCYDADITSPVMPEAICAP